MLTSAKLAEIHSSSQPRKLNRLKAITGSLAIEGNTLILEQDTAIVEGKLVRGTQREIAEVKGLLCSSFPNRC